MIELFIAPGAGDAIDAGDGGVWAGWGGGDDGNRGLGHVIGLNREMGMLVWIGGKGIKQVYGDKGKGRGLWRLHGPDIQFPRCWSRRT